MDAPYIIEINGVPVRCATAEAALELIRLNGSSGAPTPSHRRQHASGNGQAEAAAHNTRWTDQRIDEFFKMIEGKPQRRLIDELLKYDDRTDEQLIGLLQLGSGSALGGVFSGLWKNAKKVGADPTDLYVRQTVMIGDRRAFEYALSPGFRQAAKRHLAGK